MTRNLKALGLALLAVFAMSAVVAQAASAQAGKGWLTSDGPVKLTGTDTVGEKSELTAFGQAVACHGHYTVGKINETPHGIVDASGTTITTLTVAPHYTNCATTNPVQPATVTMNGCDYVLHLGLTKETGVYNVTADLVCPVGQEVTVEVFSAANHATTVCTIHIPAKEGIGGGTAQTIAEGGVHKITLQGPFTGFKATRTGILCGGESTTEEAKLDIHAILSGTNEAGAATGITLTDTA